jgi:putative lipoprotein
MKKYFSINKIILLILLSINISNLKASTTEDYSFASDKQKHFIGSTFMGGIFETILENKNYNFSNKEKIIYSVSGSMTIGIFKEVMDSREENNIFSKADLTYDFAGSVLGSVTSFYIHRYFDKKTDINFDYKKQMVFLNKRF